MILHLKDPCQASFAWLLPVRAGFAGRVLLAARQLSADASAPVFASVCPQICRHLPTKNVSKYCHDVPRGKNEDTHETIESIGYIGVFYEK